MLTSEWKGEGGSRERRGVKPTPLRSASGEMERRARLALAKLGGSEDMGALPRVSKEAARRFRARAAVSWFGRELEIVLWRSGRASESGDMGWSGTWGALESACDLWEAREPKDECKLGT